LKGLQSYDDFSMQARGAAGAWHFRRCNRCR
jgi:hypothetical protein